MRSLFLSWLCMLGATTLLQAQTPSPPPPTGSGEEKNANTMPAASADAVAGAAAPRPVKVVPNATRKPKPARVLPSGAGVGPDNARGARSGQPGKSARAPRVGVRAGQPGGPGNSNAGGRRRSK